MNRNYKDSVFTKLFSIVVLIKHQSTINLNLPLRFFIYGGRVFGKILVQLGQKKTVYQERPAGLPGTEAFGFLSHQGKFRQPGTNREGLQYQQGDDRRLCHSVRGVARWDEPEILQEALKMSDSTLTLERVYLKKPG
jgi:hypothetical protein